MKPWRPPMSAPSSEAEQQGDDPDVRPVVEPVDGHRQAEEVEDAVGLDQRHRVAEEAEQRPDRQVDVPRHDDEDHARRHDGDGRALDREVPEVAGGEEAAVGQDVEGDPDRRQRRQHPEQAGVDLGRGQRGPPVPARRRRRGQHRRRVRWCLDCRHQIPLVALPAVDVPPAHLGRRARRWTTYADGRSGAGRDRPGFHAVAEVLLGDPAGVEDHVQVVLRDRDRAPGGST